MCIRDRHWLVDGPLKIDETSASRYTTDLGTTLSNHTADIVGWAAAHVGIVTGGLSALLLTLFCALFLLADDGSIWRWIVRLLPRGAHNHVDLAGAAAWRTLVVYMRSLVLLALLNAAAMLHGQHRRRVEQGEQHERAHVDLSLIHI